jgi:SPP1 gp7 family putative phage head morphogenesis protein
MNSRDYWLKREEEALKHRITDEKEYQREIQQIYQNMLDACQKEIESFYAKYASAEGISIAEAKKRVSKHDVKAFERKAAKYVKEKDFSDKANEELRLYNATMKINRLEMLKANIGLETIAGHDELEKFVAGILKGRTEDELKRQAGILGKTVLNNAAKANAIVNGSFKVARVGDQSTFSDRIWQYQDAMRQDLGKLLQQGLIQGKNPRAITKDLRQYWYGKDPKTGGGAKYCMERLMRTELARVQTEAQKQSFERNGFKHYEFIANIGCCPLCMAKDGKHFEVKKMMPGENAPPMHPHCRCSTAAWEDSEEYEAWLDYLEQGGTTEEWNKLKEQPKRTRSMRRDPSKFRSNTEKVETIEQLQEYSAKHLSTFGVNTDVKDAGRYIDSAKENIDQLCKLLSEYRSTMKSFNIKKGAVSNEGGATTYFSDRVSGVRILPSNIRKGVQLDDKLRVGNNKHIETTTHEFAHTLSKKEIKADDSFWKEITLVRTKYRKALKSIDKAEFVDHSLTASEAAEARKKIYISDYAEKDIDEFMAEAFAQAKLGESPSEYSLMVLEIVDKHFKKKG